MVVREIVLYTDIYIAPLTIDVDVGGAGRECALPIVEKCLYFRQLLPPFPLIFWFSPNIFDQSMPVPLMT